MARAALSWTVRDLAEAAHLHRNTISNIETGKYAGDQATLEILAAVFRRAGVEFIEENGGGPGVRLRKRQHPATSTASRGNHGLAPNRSLTGTTPWSVTM